VTRVAGGARGKTDLAAFFLLRAALLGRSLGLLTTNSVAQTGSREVGLDHLMAEGWTIPRSKTSASWPGDATVSVVVLWLWHEGWGGRFFLDDVQVSGISTLLRPRSRVEGKPLRLAKNSGFAHIGSKPRGEGFVLERPE